MKRARLSCFMRQRVDADDRREPIWVRSGPIAAGCRSPAHRVARAAACREEQLAAPRGRSKRLAGSRLVAATPSNSAAGMATTCSAISACGPPQYSAHWPRKTPGRSARRRRYVVRPGIMSTLPASFGIQKLWMTSADRSANSTVRPAGMRISLALRDRVGRPPGIVDAPPPLLADHLDADLPGISRAAPRHPEP